VLVTESAGVLLLTVSVSVFDAVFWVLLLSLTVIVTPKVPATVGVPNGAPLEELIDIPLGKPVADHV